jgi:hypothetical protein
MAIDTIGSAIRFAIGDSGASSWNHQAIAGSVPRVAPIVANDAWVNQVTTHGRSGGTHRASRGTTRTRPTMAPNDSW